MNVWRLSRKDAAVGIVLLVLLAIAVWSFITRADVGTIHYEGRIQTGSVLDWSYRPKSRRVIPGWARFSTRMVSESATLLSQKGSHGLIHAFVAPSSMDEWDLSTIHPPEAAQPVQLVDSELKVESQTPFEIFVSPIFDSRILFFSGDNLALFIRNDAMYSLGGQLDESVHYKGRSVELSGAWGQTPRYMTLSYPPQYSEAEQRTLAVQLSSGEDNTISAFPGRGTYIHGEKVSELELNVSVDTATLEGMASGKLSLSGRIKQFTSDEEVEISFLEVGSGQLMLSVQDRSIQMIGTADTVRISGNDVRPRSIEQWPWWVQSIFSGLVGFFAALALESAKARSSRRTDTE